MPFVRILHVLLPICAAAAWSQTWLATDPHFQHQTGSAFNGSAWTATVHDADQRYMTYGPYTTDVPADADILVTVWLAVDNNVADNAIVAVVDVNDATTQTLLTNATVLRGDFESAFQIQPFQLFARTPAAGGAQLEFRVYYVCCSQLIHAFTTVQTLGDSSAMNGFWNDTAHFQFVSKAQFPSPNGQSGMNVGFHFTSMGGVWYLFHREYFFEPQPSYCTADYARILVRTSTDRGVTWSNASVVVSPSPGTPFECAIVDGAAHYDAARGQWLYLGQCLARDDVWNMCLFTRQGASPLGAFAPFSGNPVVRSGQLWDSICGNARSHCVQGMGEEGTPEIVMQDDAGYYYITFHGWDPTHTRSARGIAKTLDFVAWRTQGINLPGDAMFTSADCDTWNIAWAQGGCVGGGEGTILFRPQSSSDFMYHLIEAPDITLGCLTQPGQQNWVLGLSRAPAGAFLPTRRWSPFASVPTVVPAVKQGCYIQYHRLFSDAAGVYLTFWADGWLQIFMAAPGRGALPIVAGPPPGR